MKKWKYILSETDFYKIYTLLSDCPWILDKEEALEELWSFCNNETQKKLIYNFLHEFNLIEEAKRKDLEKQIYNQIIHVWKLDPKKTWFVPITEKGEIDGASMIVDSLKQQMPEGFEPKHFLNRITLIQSIKSDQNIIIVDDFIGSGKKLIRKLKYAVSIQEKKAKKIGSKLLHFIHKITRQKYHKITNIYCVSPVGMEFGIKNIYETLKNQTNIYVPCQLKKAISEKYTEKEIETNKKELKSLSIDFIGKNRAKNYLGFSDSETLFSYKDRNIPNNVFPIFWKKINDPKALDRKFMFTRRK